MAISDKYINYNLSLVNPNEIDLGAIPSPEKTELHFDTEVRSEDKTRNLIENSFLPEEKTGQPIPNNTLNETKDEDPISIEANNKGYDALLARWFPIEPIDGEFKTKTIGENGQLEEFEVTEANKGKADPEDESLSNNIGTTMIDPDTGETVVFRSDESNKGKGSADVDYISTNIKTKTVNENGELVEFDVNEGNKGKDLSAEGELDPTIKAKLLKDGTLEEVMVDGVNKGKIKVEEETIDPFFETRILDQAYESKKSSEAPSKYKSFRISDKNKSKEESVDLSNHESFLKAKIAKTPYTNEELSYDEVVNKLRRKGQKSNFGSLHVYPVNPSSAGGIASKYEIPFEFNAKVMQGGTSAKYEATSLLSRIGDIQSYIKTEGTNVQISTAYQVLSAERPSEILKSTIGDHSSVGSWMEEYTLSAVQRIEMAYRGLVYPQTSRDGGSFFRPPIVKVIFGNSKKVTDGKLVNNVPFNNLLTYPYVMSGSTKMYHRNFIVSKVDIKKDWESSPLVLNEDNDGIIDLQGFSVIMDLIEVDPMYIGVLPNFNDYYSLARQFAV